MNRISAGILALSLVLVGSLAVADGQKADPAKDPLNYDELFSFPPKAKLDEKQQAGLAELRRNYEPQLTECWQLLTGQREKITTKDGTTIFRSPDGRPEREQRQRLVRQVTRKKYALLSDEQKQALGVVIIPPVAQEKALNDPKIWDVEQLEKVYDVQSKSFDPDQDAIYLLVLTKKPWTQAEEMADDIYWSGVRQSGRPDDGQRIQAIFYDKTEAKILTLSPWSLQWGSPAITRTEAKLTEKEAEAGLKRYRMKIDLTLDWDWAKEAASVKIIYPHPKEEAPEKKDK